MIIFLWKENFCKRFKKKKIDRRFPAAAVDATADFLHTLELEEIRYANNNNSPLPPPPHSIWPKKKKSLIFANWEELPASPCCLDAIFLMRLIFLVEKHHVHVHVHVHVVVVFWSCITCSPLCIQWCRSHVDTQTHTCNLFLSFLLLLFISLDFWMFLAMEKAHTQEPAGRYRSTGRQVGRTRR